jgi:hypothetical protein
MLSWSPRSSHRVAGAGGDPFSLYLANATSNLSVLCRPVDLTLVNRIRDKIKPFRDSDAWLRELHTKFDEYAELVEVYNGNLQLCGEGQGQGQGQGQEGDGDFSTAANRNFSTAFSDTVVQGCLHISPTSMTVIEEHAEFIIASKLLNPR